ncbi:MAG: calcium/sodium antiporter [Bacteroidaceae bacterium]|nr:calcium/sodium antiporter [Bacteroidaceae bacterium]MBQ8454219.1 calcium/sodium antiporter [Bacteroidaceae bacterium]MBQ9170498.1 calcium/sodium antiporter [Bacteroidaceae bacterium]MBQ9295172.1 calcium/sodium antiporter [Bacteroidaceae bacterium]
MILEIVLIVVSIAVVLWGADRFTDGASGLARRLKVSELVIGLTVVALGTSLPEFMVSFMSVLRGSSDMSVGNIIGSNVFNILVILGVSAIMRSMPVEKTLLRRDLPICLAFSVLLVTFAVTGDVIARWEGLLLVCCFCGYMYLAYRIAMQDRKAPLPTSPKGEEKVEASLWRCLLLILVGMAALVVGGKVLVDNAAAVAREWGISESVIGMTILAGGTSLPELATSVVAARKGSLGLAFGNVVGSNIFNIAFVVGTCGCIMPMPVTEITLIDWVALIGSCILLWLTALTSRKLSKGEGILLVCCYLSYLSLLLAR